MQRVVSTNTVPLQLGQEQQKNDVKAKVKQSRNRPGVVQRVTGGLGSQIFMTFTT